jgi:geranylgeranyl pyrophosphate synthase
MGAGMTVPTRLVPDGLREELDRLEERLRRTSERLPGPYSKLLDLMFEAGGKRIRPALVFAASGLAEPNPEAVRNLAAAVETLHAATLVHDDLVDQSAMRRGAPTLNSRWGAGATVLAGDWLFARSARFAASTGSLRVMEIFARTLQTLTDGELRQLVGRRNAPTVDEYEDRIYCKTASLFEASTEMSAVLARLPEDDIQALASFGRELGMAFQIVDDILDFTGDDRRLGKPVGSDLRAGTVTLPAILHYQRHDLDVQALRSADGAAMDEAVQRVAEDPQAIAGATASARERLARAEAALDRLPDSASTDLLRHLARRAVDRDR